MSLEKLYELTSFILSTFNPVWYEAKMDVYKAVLENKVKNIDEFLMLHECIQQD